MQDLPPLHFYALPYQQTLGLGCLGLALFFFSNEINKLSRGSKKDELPATVLAGQVRKMSVKETVCCQEMHRMRQQKLWKCKEIE